MGNGKNFCFGATACGLLMVFLLTVFAGTITGAPKDVSVPKWEWTEQNTRPGWWQWDTREEKPVRGGVLHTAAPRYVGMMNPNKWPVLDWGFITQVYDGIAYIDSSQLPRGLWLAKSYKYVDSTTVIMELRPGIQFHDGTPFNAGAVKFNTDYIKDRRNGCWTLSWVEPVESVEVLDELTVKWNFKRPWPGFMGMMSTVPGYIISPKALEGDIALKQIGRVERELKQSQSEVAKLEGEIGQASGEKAETLKKNLDGARARTANLAELFADYTEKIKEAKNLDANPVGTGAYILEEGKPGSHIKLTRNPNWWFGQAMGMDMPFYDGRMITIIPDESVQLANLRAGRIDAMGLSSTQYLDLKDDPNFNINFTVLNFLIGLRFNQAKGPCSDIRVRKAISHAIDRKAIVEGLVHGRGAVASGPYHQAHWCHNPNLEPVTYNPELSRKLLKEAGYKRGLTIRGTTGTTTAEVTRAEAIKAMLANVGITWQVASMDAVARDDRAKNLEYDMSDGGWSFIKEPDMMASSLWHPDGSFNYGRNKVPKAIELIERGKQELDMEKRQKIYWELEEVLLEDYTDVFIYYPHYHSAMSKRIRGYVPEAASVGGEYYGFSHRNWFQDGRRTN